MTVARRWYRHRKAMSVRMPREPGRELAPGAYVRDFGDVPYPRDPDEEIACLRLRRKARRWFGRAVSR